MANNLLEVLQEWLDHNGSTAVAVPVHVATYTGDEITLRPVKPGVPYNVADVQYLLISVSADALKRFAQGRKTL